MPRAKVTKVCEHCKAEYECVASKAGTRRFCSPACFHAHTKAQHDYRRVCPTCGKEFSYTKRKPSKHCSVECANLGKRKRIKRCCEECGEVYEVHFYQRGRTRFCSVDCKHKHMEKVEAPDATLLKILLNYDSMGEVARTYGVYAGSVRHWCKRLGVDWPGHEARQEIMRGEKIPECDAPGCRAPGYHVHERTVLLQLEDGRHVEGKVKGRWCRAHLEVIKEKGTQPWR
jgi:hypothetical protein